MKAGRWLALISSGGLVLSAVAATAGPAAASPRPSSNRAVLHGSLTPAQERAHPGGLVPPGSRISFDILLRLRNAAGAQSFVRQVSTPGSPGYRHYLTDAAWTARFGPTAASVTRARHWLTRNGFSVGSVPRDRLLVAAAGTARNVERAFGISLRYYRVHGHTVRLATGALSIPASLTGTVTGVAGVNQYLATTSLSQAGLSPASPASPARPAQQPAPPAGFRNARPCSAYWGQKTDTRDSGKLYAPYTHPLRYDICGYRPAQLRGAYGLAGSVARGINGKGVGIAIVDAYDSPTLLSDAQTYFRRNDPAHMLTASQFVNLSSTTVDDQAECGGSGWYDEQALDVEASHSMAPGATIYYVGAQDCQDTSLLAADNTAVTSGASVVSNSWGDTLGDIFTDAASRTAFDNVFLLADGTGVSVLFSAGDSGDNFADYGLTAPDYPASSPYITAVGGTTLEIGARNNRTAEYGWSTARQEMCTSKAPNCGHATEPAGSLAWQAGGGGGTSYTYAEPWYQAKVVPSALALRNVNVTGAPARVVPDISMDADAQSGMLIGLTQTFPDGVYYDQFKEGGTSLASPLLAGVTADTDQAAGTALGFLNPSLYKAYTSHPAAFNDIVPPAKPLSTAVVRVDYANSVSPAAGYVVSMRVIDYEGVETYCDPTGNCASRPVTLTTAKGYDSLTGLGSAGPQFISVMSRF